MLSSFSMTKLKNKKQNNYDLGVVKYLLVIDGSELYNVNEKKRLFLPPC